MKVTIVGAGAVGASCAEYIAMKNFATEVVLVDIQEGIAEGKAMDLMQTACFNDFDTKILGYTNNYKPTADSDVVVIASGVPRKPGMTREELIQTNANIVKGVLSKILEYSKNPILIMVSNPLDTMTYLAHKISNLPKNKIIGMGGALDSARFKYRLAQLLNAPISDVEAMVIGAHSDTGMVPLGTKATRKGVPVSYFLTEEELQFAIQETKLGGATLTKLLGTSAWYAPGAAVASIVQSIACDFKKIYPCSAMLQGEYGVKDVCVGVPVVIGKNGIESIVDIPLTEDEKCSFDSAVQAVQHVNKQLMI